MRFLASKNLPTKISSPQQRAETRSCWTSSTYAKNIWWNKSKTFNIIHQKSNQKLFSNLEDAPVAGCSISRNLAANCAVWKGARGLALLSRRICPVSDEHRSKIVFRKLRISRTQTRLVEVHVLCIPLVVLGVSSQRCHNRSHTCSLQDSFQQRN